jgi:uncharacterized protein (TIGR00251 family)
VIALEQHTDAVVIPVRVRAGARRTGLAGVHNGALRVEVTAAPEKGKANQAIITLLSKTLGVAKSHIAILSGETSPQKRVQIAGMKLTEAQQRLNFALGLPQDYCGKEL